MFYYYDFEILNESMYNKIFKHDPNNHQKNYYTRCLFFEKIIMIEISPNITNINKFVLEVGMLNNDYIFWVNKDDILIKADYIYRFVIV